VPIAIKRAYDPPLPSDGYRLLVDRIWPRGVSREALEIADWRRDLAPSTELRRWFGHDPVRWDEFRRRYERELDDGGQAGTLEGLARRAETDQVTLVYGARDREHNEARVLAELIGARMRRADGTS
jgi:uncharacterized protein YeaO (DUF488 family)